MTNVVKSLVPAILAGMLGGVVLYHTALWLAGSTTIDRQMLVEQGELIDALKEDNRLLSDDLFGVREPVEPTTDDLLFPYRDDVDARAAVVAARAAAIEEGRFLMITFGANWCVDCRTLYKTLGSDKVVEYTGDRFRFINVNIGEFNRNIDVAIDLGVTLGRGIPVAIFYDPSGDVIGTTNGGELEPARLYTSTQILQFVKDIAERAEILAPDAVRNY
jgi:thiol:disulfide interchange protein